MSARSLLQRGTLQQASEKATYKLKRSISTPAPLPVPLKYSSNRVVCGVDPVGGHVWSFTSAGVYQVDSLTASNWSAVTLPANTTTNPYEAACVVWTPPAGSPTLFLLIGNSSNSLVELYSAPVVAKGTAPTWTLRKQFTANAQLIPHALTVTSYGLYVGEYSSSPEPAAGCSVYRTTDGTTFTTVLGPLTDGTRHVHGIYEDPYAVGTVYITLGDQTAPHMIYKSTNGTTFTPVAGTDANLNAWQCVAMGFSADWIWCASDQSQGFGPYLLDRATLTPRWATTKTRHDRIPVPGATGARILTDVATTSGSATITSATGNFTAADKGRGVEASPLGYGQYIVTVTNTTTVVLNTTVGSTNTNMVTNVLGDTFYATAYVGAIDPATGWFYYVAQDSSVKGTTGGVFVIMGPDEPPTLLYPIYNTPLGNHKLYIAGGLIFYHIFGALPLLAP